MDRADDDERVSLTDALPTEMVCRIVSLFRPHPGDWMALLLTSRTMAAACRATLDPASDRVHWGANGTGPTLAARLVGRHAKDVPTVLDAYRCANASALLVEACRAGDLALMRVLLDGRAKWRVDVAYRHNRPLLECVRLNSAIGVQLLLATGHADPVDHPGAAHLGRCAMHDDPACRRPGHPGLCDACARGQPGGPWSDSDDDEDDDEDGGDAYGGAYLDAYDDDPLADTDEGDEGDDDREDHHDPSPVDQQGVGDGSAHVLPAESGPMPAVAATTAVPIVQPHGGGGGGDGDFEVDYDALFEIENGDGEGSGDDDDGDDDDYEPHASVYASLVDDDENEDDTVDSRRGHKRAHGDDDDGQESGDDEPGRASLWTGDDLDDRINNDDGSNSEPRHEAVAWGGAADPTAPAQVIPAGSNSNDHALAVRRADLARCVCRGGMTFAIVWIDDQGREIGGRVQGPVSEPLWFLVCEDPTALVADGPLSFLTAHAHPPDRATAPLWYGDDDGETASANEGHVADVSVATIPADHLKTDDATQDQDGDTVNTNETPNQDDGDDGDTMVQGQEPFTPADSVINTTVGNGIASQHEEGDGHQQASPDANNTGTNASVVAVGDHGFVRVDGHERSMMRVPCTCASGGRPFYTQAMERWCPLFWAALMSVGVLGQLLGHVCVEPPTGRPGAGMPAQRWACRPSDVLMMAVAQMVVFSSASRMASLSDIHATALDLILRAGAIDLAAHGDFLVAFAADRGCSEIIEMLVEYGGDAIDVAAHNDLALRRALWRYVRLYRPAFGAGARLEPEERSSRMCLYAAALVALASAAGLDTGGMDPADALMEPLDPGFVRTLARRVYPGMTANEIGRLRLAPLRPHYPPPFTPPL
ncbi:metallo-dependent hydrolase incomplete domain containing protein [Pandoravirus celtis]|uniref:Metallo-dependent hydrolase incomplete domain containing protein n=1 Tax=Pandoravirus celtis TaxID=2568002 RepID=A0A4D6EG19_9VIRU|nr:metallo-dependent hydrolase incomplete domain containing protein [Pandoravirus celtis]